MEKKSDYTFIVSPSAEENIDKIIRYISIDLENRKAASALIESFYKKIHDIIAFPYSYPIFNNEYLIQKGIRKAKIKNFNIFYVINEEEKEIIIMEIMHNKEIK